MPETINDGRLRQLRFRAADRPNVAILQRAIFRELCSNFGWCARCEVATGVYWQLLRSYRLCPSSRFSTTRIHGPPTDHVNINATGSAAQLCTLHSARGFALVELVIVVLVIAILASLVGARAASLTKQARINSMRIEASKSQQAAMIFLNRNGRWPNDVSDGVYPPDFAGYIPNYTFLTGPGMGGVWDWNGIGATLPHYGIAVRAMNTVTDLIDLFQEVDNQADDGNPATGSIQIVVRSTKTFLQFVLETR